MTRYQSMDRLDSIFGIAVGALIYSMFNTKVYKNGTIIFAASHICAFVSLYLYDKDFKRYIH